MIGVICFAEDRKESFFNDIVIWQTTARAFNVDVLVIVDTYGDLPKWSDTQNFENTHITSTLDEAIDYIDETYPNHTIVYLDINGDEKVGKFKHPNKDVVYLFGPDSGEITPKRFDKKVKIDVPEELWASQIFAAVMLDRGNK